MNAAQDRRAADARREALDTEAATRIQAAMRGQDERWWTDGEKYDNDEEAAWGIQGALRGKSARESVDALRREEEGLAQERLDAVARGKRDRMSAKERRREESEQEEAARRIQAAAAGKERRLLHADLMQTELELSSARLQGMARGRGVRGSMQSRQAWYEIEGDHSLSTPPTYHQPWPASTSLSLSLC